MGMDQTPAMGPGLVPTDGFPDFNTGLSPFSNTNSSAFMGMEFSLPPPNLVDMQTDGFNPVGAASPMSMFTNFGSGSGTGPDLTANFDWVNISRTSAKDHY